MGALYKFFSSKDTPGSGFYMALLGIAGTLGPALIKSLETSTDKHLAIAGAAIAAVYAAAQPIAAAIEASRKVVVTSPTAPVGGASGSTAAASVEPTATAVPGPVHPSMTTLPPH